MKNKKLMIIGSVVLAVILLLICIIFAINRKKDNGANNPDTDKQAQTADDEKNVGELELVENPDLVIDTTDGKQVTNEAEVSIDDLIADGFENEKSSSSQYSGTNKSDGKKSSDSVGSDSNGDTTASDNSKEPEKQLNEDGGSEQGKNKFGPFS